MRRTNNMALENSVTSICKKNKLNTMSSDLAKPYDNTCINDFLNDDCLINIFENLRMVDRLTVETVCKRWSVLGKLSWQNFTNLTISKIEFQTRIHKNKFPNNATLNLKNIFKVLKRCGPKLNSINIKNDLILNVSLLISGISMSCNNITQLSLENTDTFTKFCNDLDLELLFNRNKNLSRISLKNLNISGVCLKSLCAESITELKIDGCLFAIEGHLQDVFKKLKNVNIFYLSIEDADSIDQLIKSLNESGCENIHHFSLMFLDKIIQGYPEELLKLISRQKNLSKFQGQVFINDENFLQVLSPDSLEELEINCRNPCLISRFEKLKRIKFFFENIDDEFMENLTQCKNLEIVDLNSLRNTLTEEGAKKFTKLENMRKLKFLSDKRNIDNILIALSWCKNLIELDITNCYFTNSGLRSIASNLKNLQILNIVTLSKIKKSEIINVMIKLKNLIQIYFKGFKNLNYEFLKALSDVKERRKDKNRLEVVLAFRIERIEELSKYFKGRKNLPLVCCSTRAVFYNNNATSSSEDEDDDSEDDF